MTDDLLSEITKNTVEAEAEADRKRLAPDPVETAKPTKKKREWRGKSAAEMMANRGRIGSTTDVHTGGAKELP